MPYQVDRFNGTFLVSVADGTVDSTTDLRFLGKNYAGYGEVQNENFLHLLENFANTTPPSKAIGGQIWYDSATKRLKYYDQDNNKWRTTGGIEASPTAPIRLNVGDLWYDTSADQLYSWNGTAFVLIGPQPTVGGTLTPVNVDLVSGTDGLNYNIVSLKSGSGSNVAIFSVDSFIPSPTAGSENDYIGFDRIRRGINLFGTNESGVTAGDFKFWGTASNADRLGGVVASEYIRRGDSNFDSTVEFPRIKIGAQPDRNIEIGTEGSGSNPGPYIESIRGENLTIRIRDSQIIHNLMRFSKPDTGIAGAVFPGLSGSYNFGTPGNTWNNIYAQNVIGNVQGNLTGNTTGVHKGNLIADNNEVVFNAANRQFQGTFNGTFFGTLNGDITGSATQASSLNGIIGSTDPQPNTIAIRTSVTDPAGAGHIRANRFIGAADRAEQLRFGNSYISSSTASAGNTIVVRDSSGNINVNSVNGNATSANTLRADNGPFRTASTAAVGNTIVVRDAAGNIAVNGIVGSATQANQLLVDNSTFRVASVNAIANTVAVRDSQGIFRSSSIQNTPIGTIDRAAGAFTTLAANGIVSFSNATETSSSSSGSLIVSGGVGVAKGINIGGNFVIDQSTTLGTIAGNTRAITTFVGRNSNVNYLDTFMLRTSAGGDWTTAGTRIQQRIDATWMAWMQFNGTNSNAGISWGSGSATTTPQSIPERMRLDSAGSLRILSNIASTSTTTGSLIVTGGIGVSGQLTAGAIVETSSIAFKENVKPINNALDLVLNLCGVTYDRKDGSRKDEAGLIAEEVEKVIPNIVVKDDNGNPYGICYSKLTVFLVESIKALKDEINVLKERK